MKTYQKRINLRVNDSMYDVIARMASLRGVPVSTVIRDILYNACVEYNDVA